MLNVANDTLMLSDVMLSVIMLSVIKLSVIMLSVAMLSVAMLSVVMLSVIMLSVVIPSAVASKRPWSISSLTNEKLSGIDTLTFRSGVRLSATESRAGVHRPHRISA